MIAAIIAASLTTSITVPPILPKMMAHFSHEPRVAVLVPLVVSLPFVVSVLVAPFIGHLSDKVDRRTITILASLLATVFGVAPYFLDSLPAILVARVLMGLPTAALLVCTSAMIGDLFEGPKRRGVLGFKYAVLGVTHVLAFIIIGHLAAHDWRDAFWIFLWGLVAAAMLAIFIPRSTASVADAASPKIQANIPWPVLAPVFIGVFLGASAFDTLLTGVAFLLEERGLPGTVRGGYVASFASLGMLIGASAYPFVSRRISGRHIWVATFALAALGFLMLAAIPAFPAIMAGMIIVGTGCGMVSPNSLNHLLGHVPPTARGKVAGVQTTFFFLGLGSGPLIGVTLGKALGSHVLLFWLVSGVLSCVAILFALFGPGRDVKGAGGVREAATPGAF